MPWGSPITGAAEVALAAGRGVVGLEWTVDRTIFELWLGGL